MSDRKTKYKIVLLAAVVLGIAGCVCVTIIGFVVLSQVVVADPQPDYYVEYVVTGGIYSASLTYENQSGNTEQRDIIQGTIMNITPWTLGFSANYGDFVYLSAQNNHNDGTITCEIKVNGKVIESATSQGAYVIATCSGRVR
ncbi:MAG: hypothetical protein WAM60_12445 [Candidatus Promineifilaceae bacterium]